MPERAILFLERDQLPISRRARIAARIMQQHESQQRHVFRIVGYQFNQRARQANGFGAEFTAQETVSGTGGVAFVEDK